MPARPWADTHHLYKQTTMQQFEFELNDEFVELNQLLKPVSYTHLTLPTTPYV